ncbi:MAG: hypothetical protein K2F81_01975 [Ruminococcus sp.]|nr:hypothetical protein [Ruminococcus sp.]
MYKTRSEAIGENSAVQSLCTAILIQAVLDYQDLNKRGIVSRRDKKRGNYSKNEIARFFKSDWCGCLLESIGGNFTGEYILSCLQAQKPIN